MIRIEINSNLRKLADRRIVHDDFKKRRCLTKNNSNNERSTARLQYSTIGGIVFNGLTVEWKNRNSINSVFFHSTVNPLF